MPLESQPHHNKMFNFYSHQQDDMCGRVRDTRSLEICSQMYGFFELLEPLQPCNINWNIKTDRNCIIMIQEIPPSVSHNILFTCHEISQNQPITDLWMNKIYCDTSQVVPDDVFNMSETAESITIANSTLPHGLMEHLINQLLKCSHLRKLHIENVTLHNVPTKQVPQVGTTDTNVCFALSSAKFQSSSSELKRKSPIRSQSNPPHFIGKHITSGMMNYSLQQLTLIGCLMPGDRYSFLTKCIKLTHLNLNGNKLGKGGKHIVEMLGSLGSDSQLQLLYLNGCSIPSNICGEILKCLKKCKHLRCLDLGEQSLKKEAKYLIELIKNFGDDPPLQQLHLENCSISELECTEMLQCLSKYRNLTHLKLNGNIVGMGGIHIVEMLGSLGSDSQLQLLYLNGCSIPSNICGEILKCLKKCKHLTHLDLGEQNLEKEGKYLVELIKNFGEDPPLQQLYLGNCSIPQIECTEMLKCLSKYRHITALELNGNKVGMGGIHIVEMINNLGSDSQLQLLYLNGCSISSNICGEILKCLKKCKHLRCLDLGEQNLEKEGKHLVELIKNLEKSVLYRNCTFKTVP